MRHREDVKTLYMSACEQAGKAVDKEMFEGPVNWLPDRPYSDLEYLEAEGMSFYMWARKKIMYCWIRVSFLHPSKNFTTFWTNSADNKLKMLFLIFPKKNRL